MMEKPELPGNTMPGLFASALEYLVDAGQRSVLFMDVMRRRGEQYREQQDNNRKPVSVVPRRSPHPAYHRADQFLTSALQQSKTDTQAPLAISRRL